MRGFLKGYYGYKNLGDEILLLGVINYIFPKFDLDSLSIQSGDVQFLQKWLQDNQKFIYSYYDKIEVLSKKHIGEKKGIDINFFGGGEFLTQQRNFPHDGYNLLIKNFLDVFSRNFVLLGGIGKVTKLKTKILYKLLLPNAKNIIVREKYSYDIACKYNLNTILHNDFAWDIVKTMLSSVSNPSKIILININPYIYNDKAVKQILDFVARYPDYDKYFVPMDIHEDSKHYQSLQDKIPELQLWDWTQYDLTQIIDFFSRAEAGIGARLHFLLILRWLGRHIEPLFYQEKINKFFDR